jgi:hypothetical protein
MNVVHRSRIPVFSAIEDAFAAATGGLLGGGEWLWVPTSMPLYLVRP